MKKKLIFIVLFVNVLYSNTIDVDENKCITKKELMVILKNMFPNNKNIKHIEDNKRNELYRGVLDKFPNKPIIKKLKYFHKKGNSDSEVMARCDYLINNREMIPSNRAEILNICADYKLRYYEYDTSIKYLEELLDSEHVRVDIKEIIGKLIILYGKKGDKDKVRYLKNIIND